MRAEAKALPGRSALALVVALVLLPAGAGAVCPNTVETDEGALWNIHNCWPEFRKMFRLKRFPQVWISNSEPYEMSELKRYPYKDTWPFYKAIYEEFGGKQLVWGTGYPRPRWELPMDKELEFVDKVLDFYTPEDRELLLGKNALRIWRFPGA